MSDGRSDAGSLVSARTVSELDLVDEQINDGTLIVAERRQLTINKRLATIAVAEEVVAVDNCDLHHAQPKSTPRHSKAQHYWTLGAYSTGTLALKARPSEAHTRRGTHGAHSQPV